MEFYTSIAASHARYTGAFDDGTGHAGEYIPNAPGVIASVAAHVSDLGPWTGGFEFRYLSEYPLTPDNPVKGKGYSDGSSNGNYAFRNA